MSNILDDILAHEGRARRSGRYPWGSGENPNQRTGDFLSRVDTMKDQGKSEKEIAALMGLSSSEFRTQRAVANTERRAYMVATAESLKKDGLSLDQIAKKMGFPNDSSVRALLDPKTKERMEQAGKTAEFLKSKVDELGMIEVGAGVNLSLNISNEKMKEALYSLELDGYPTHRGRTPQVTNPGKMTTITVLCPPGTEHKEIYKFDQVHNISDKYVSRDGGKTFDPFVYPSSMDSSRLKINYAEDGGTKKDGVIELRRGVSDLSLGDAHYAQIRVLVDNDRYMKGMAIYSDNMPDGVDVVFNTNKKKGTPTRDVLKEIKKDDINPFGSLIKANGQSYYDDPNGTHVDPVTGKKQSLSLINKRAEEGDWGDWSDTLPAQFLSKQPRELIKKQLNLAKADKQAEYEEIMSLTNPTIKKAMLKTFAEDCDSAAVHLQAAALPRQKYKVILPVSTLKDDEIYAPTFEPGEKVALVRYPHGGTFEIPVLTVNNKHPDAKRILENAADAVGINSKVAERLSGADFDGDTVMVIPTGGRINILSTKALPELKDFDPKGQYQYNRIEVDSEGTKHYFRGDHEFRPMKNTQTEMGMISNLITDMTLKGANEKIIAPAVKHSMVVIDAEKHGLDYKQSALDNDIAGLKKRWQGRVEDGKYREGASTLISKSKSEQSVLKRKGSPIIDPETGEVTYKLANEPYQVVRYKDPATGKMVKPSKEQLQSYKAAVARGEKPSDFEVQIKSDGEYETVKYRNPSTGKAVTPSKDKYIDPETGKETSPYNEMMRKYRTAVENGDSLDDFIVKTNIRMQPSTKMAEAKDARDLSSGTIPEEAYADYANTMKALANNARKSMLATKDVPYSSSAKETYKEEVQTLMASLNNANKNSPRERFANMQASAIVQAKKEANPDMTNAEIKKEGQRQLIVARLAVGAQRDPIKLSDREWEAIQAGAVSPSKLTEIINHVDSDKLRERATPRTVTKLSPVTKNQIKALVASGYTTSDIAKKLGKSPTTINDYLLGKGVNKDS